MRLYLAGTLCCALALIAAGCGSSNQSAKNSAAKAAADAAQTDLGSASDAPPDAKAFTHTIAAETEYYTTGPQQGRPPDGEFPAGTKVNVVEPAGSYSRVEAETGVTAYVATDAIKPMEKK